MSPLWSLALVLCATLPAEEPAAGDALHQPWAELVEAHVRNGKVDYRALADEQERLDAYLAGLAAADPSAFDRPQALAFWINAYNAFTVQLILEHLGDIASIKDIPKRSRWKDERWLVGGQRTSLDRIEHEILRPMGEPRVHFALNCASVGCPDLAVFLPSRLDEQLAAATRAFLADERRGLRVVTEKGWFGGEDRNLYLSRIFDWFEEDFEGGGRDVVDFVLPYAPPAAQAYIRAHREDLDVEYLDYDWSLNGV